MCHVFHIAAKNIVLLMKLSRTKQLKLMKNRCVLMLKYKIYPHKVNTFASVEASKMMNAQAREERL